jgi:hypothetical protein
LGERRLREIDFARRAADAFQAGCGFERAQLPKRRKIGRDHGIGIVARIERKRVAIIAKSYDRAQHFDWRLRRAGGTPAPEKVEE